jgi:hypothetical protein
VSLDDLKREAAEGRASAHADRRLDTDDLDKAQRALRRKVLHQLTAGGLRANSQSAELRSRRDLRQHRSALSLIDRLERCGELTDQQKSVLSGPRSALHAAEDAAGEAVRIT